MVSAVERSRLNGHCETGKTLRYCIIIFMISVIGRIGGNGIALRG